MKNKGFFVIFRASLLFSFFLFFDLLMDVNYDFSKVDYMFIVKTYPIGLFAAIFIFYLNKLYSYIEDSHRERIFQENEKKKRTRFFKKMREIIVRR